MDVDREIIRLRYAQHREDCYRDLKIILILNRLLAQIQNSYQRIEGNFWTVPDTFRCTGANFIKAAGWAGSALLAGDYDSTRGPVAPF